VRRRLAFASIVFAACHFAVGVASPAQETGEIAISDPGERVAGDPELSPGPDASPPDIEVAAPPGGDRQPAAAGRMQIEGATADRTALPDLDLDQLSATRDRPLFQPGRRPVLPPPPPSSAAPPLVSDVVAEPPFDFELRGIVGNGADSVAILGQPGLATPLRSRAGDTLNGWTLTRIEPTTVFFIGPAGEERRLSLFEDASIWSTGENGVDHLTIGPGTSGLPASTDAPQPGAPDEEPVKSVPQVEVSPPDTAPPPDAEPKQVRKVY
jgi:hypothetical protein